MKKRVLTLTMALSLLFTPALAAEITVREITPPIYDEVYGEFSEGLMAVYKNYTMANMKNVMMPHNEGRFIDRSGTEILSFESEDFELDDVRDSVFYGNLVKVYDKREEGKRKVGLMDKTGALVIPTQYSDIGNFSDGLAYVREENFVDGKWLPDRKYGYIDETGKLVIPYQYTWAGDFINGLAMVEDAESQKWGFIDKTGNVVVPFQFECGGFEFGIGVDNFRENEGLARIHSNVGGVKLIGVIDAAGNVVVPPTKYSWIGEFHNGFAAVQAYAPDKQGLYGFIDREGNEVVPCKYSGVIEDSGLNFADGYATVANESGWGTVDATGKEIIPCKYGDKLLFHEGLAAVENDKGKWGFIDSTGAMVVPFKYTEASYFSEGLAAVRKDPNDRRWGYVDTTGKEVIPCQYRDALPFSDGLAGVKNIYLTKDVDGEEFLTGNWGFIDKTGKTVVPFQFLSVKSFRNGIGAYEDDHRGLSSNKWWGFLAIEGYAPTETAYASTQSVLVNGESVEFQCYALKDEVGNLTNYVKLRDVAAVFNNTKAKFNVGWNGAVNIETGKGYTPNGSEMKTPYSGDRAYEMAASTTNINGKPAALEAIVLKDDTGGAYTYYKLRDLGAVLGFKVDWSAEKGIFIETK